MTAEEIAAELWAMAQIIPGEGIEDAINRMTTTIQRAFEERERKLREAVIGMRKHADIFDGGKHQANRLAFDEFARAALGEKP